jgi:hypothetical protein
LQTALLLLDRSENPAATAALEVVKEVAAKVLAELIKPFIGGA